eukprot:CAMPEP_0203664430 /NCGR_PEP_ID=MMETSP0090-20130426/1843_1 /ASSEMBLY_ACC=CAM_ASM_001088 /TAXON_ID=426623 /ORGANISM="Chaetoceros affinis, Strain CCMP159" /LENGTH=294 /DNA_ID=CAMNT_0050527667 /DNA_START=77 /DNA_END=961 /DNA_ORIENTATION=-
MAYVLTPPYILSAVVLLLLGYPSGNVAFLYALPLVISMLTPARPIPDLVGLFSPMLDYFQYEQIIESEDELRKNFDQGKNYIFATQPHGVLSMCAMCSSIHSDPKYRRISTAVASSLLTFPILKHIIGIFTLCDASAASLRKVLKRPGIEGTVVIYIGGIAELFKSSRDEERLHLSSRKGFIKLALREGVDIVPVYLFGNTSILSVLRNKYLERISRKMQVSFTIFWGKFYLPIPRDDKLLYVAGAPITIPKISNPTQSDLDKYHEHYCEEIKRIFETYKHKIPLYQNKTLIID